MKRTAHLLLIFLSVLICGCSVQIYDLQPIIIGTDTPTPTTAVTRTYEAVTLVPTARPATPTPPIHIAPTAITSTIAVNILEIRMIDGGTGWAIGQIPGESDKLVLRTTDNCETWKNVTPSQAIYDNADGKAEISSCFRDADHAWLIFYEPDSYDSMKGITVWYTEDGGQTWGSAPLPVSGYSVQYVSDPQVDFIDTRNGWIFMRIGRAGDREFIGLYTTHNGGQNWSAMVTTASENLPSSGKKNGAVFRDTLEGWISAESTQSEPGSVLWHTTDGGNSWSKQQLPPPDGFNIPYGLLTDPAYTCSLSVPKFVDFQFQYAWSVLQCASETKEPVSILYWSYDRLNTWKTCRLPAFSGDLSFYGIEYGWYAVAKEPGSDYPYEILFTEDGGENWRTASQLAWDSKLQFITPAIGYGIATYFGMPALVRTSNSGFAWEQVFPMAVP